MYTANLSILYSKEKTVRILGTWHQYLVNVSGLRYYKQIEFQEELRWLDTVFQGQYLPSLSINYVAINKVLEKMPPQLY